VVSDGNRYRLRCSACQENLPVDAKFCSECGSPVIRPAGIVDIATVLEALRSRRIHPSDLATALLKVLADEPALMNEKTRNPEAWQIGESRAPEREPPKIQPSVLAEAMRPETLSAKLGVSMMTLKNWRSRGQGPKFLKAGRRILYPPEWVDEFIKAASEKPQEDWAQKNPKKEGAGRSGIKSRRRLNGV
jgi:DNA-binding transcriptional regulator YiaG